MVGKKLDHPYAYTHDLHLRSGSGWQDNPNRKYEQMQDTCSLQGETEVPKSQIHPSGKTDKTILTGNF